MGDIGSTIQALGVLGKQHGPWVSSWVATYVCCSRGRSITLRRGSSSPALRISPRCYSLHKVIHYTRCSAHPPPAVPVVVICYCSPCRLQNVLGFDGC